jgi:CheY-like chemotaxis protein
MTLKILLVDDDQEFLEIMELHLLHCFDLRPEITKAHSGEAALVLIKSKTYDLIISDLEMPRGDGYFLLKEKLNLNLNTPVIIWSGQLNVNLKNLSLLGASLFVSKLHSLQHNWVDSINELLRGSE